LPSNLPVPNQRVQIKRGVTGTDQTVSNLVASGTKLVGADGGPIQISYTPTYPCYWLVRGNAMWHGTSGGWRRCDFGIRITPADLDGITLGMQCPTQCYPNNVVEWRTWATSCMFRLAAGITYTAYLSFEYSSGDYQQYSVNINYLRILGVVIGEGEV
jgi:hypothetical protein